MALAGCSGCKHTGRCSTCLGTGKRVRISGFILKRKETVRCRVCLGSGDCRMCGGRGVHRSFEAAEAPRVEVVIPWRRPS